MFQAVDGQTFAISAQTSTKMPTSRSAPPTRAGWAMRNSPAACRSRSVSSGRRRSRSHRSARAAISGTRRRARHHLVVADARKGRPRLGQGRRGSPFEPGDGLILHRADDA